MSDGVFLVYDVASWDSFQATISLQREVRLLKDSSDYPIILVGLCTLSETHRRVRRKEGMNRAMDMRALFTEISLNQFIKVDAVLRFLIREIKNHEAGGARTTITDLDPLIRGEAP